MKNYYKGADRKLVEIFTPHCNLSGEQYEEISARFIYLEADIQDGEPIEDIKQTVYELNVVFDFLYNTKEVTLEEYNSLCNLANEMEADAERLVQA